MANISVTIVIYQMLLDDDPKLMPTENPKYIDLVKLLLGPWQERWRVKAPSHILKGLNPNS